MTGAWEQPAAWEQPDVASLGLAEVMGYIRARCPWAAAHTHTSLQKYLIEETYELLAALDDHARAPSPDTRAEVESELGDVLYQVLFHAALLDSTAHERPTAGDEVGSQLRAEPWSADALTAVVERLKAKLVRRHPHVFDSIGPVNIREVERRYEEVKAAERALAPRVDERVGAVSAEGSESVSQRQQAQTRATQARASFDSVPAAMPALTRAQSVLGRIDRLELPVPPAAVSSGAAAVSPSAAAVPSSAAAVPSDPETASEPSAEAIGRELFALVRRAHALGVDAESALRATTSGVEDAVVAQAQADAPD